MKRLLLLILSVCTIASSAQTTFRKSYNIASIDLAGGMVENPAGEFVMAGTNATFIPLYGNITKLNTSGNVVWSNSYVGGIATDLWDIKNVSGGGYVAVGSASGSGAVVLRVDNNGNLVWARRVTLPDAPTGTGSSEYASSVIQSSDGGFVVGGSVDYFWNGSARVDTTSAFGFKLDNSGNLLWSRVWTIPTANPDEHIINDVTETSDGYIFVGESSEGSGTLDSDGDYPRNALVIKTDLSGTMQYIRRWGVGNTSSQGINCAITLSGGNVLMGGYDDIHAFLLSVSGAGASPTFGATFNRRINGNTIFPIRTLIIQDIMQNSDGNYSVIGTHLEGNLIPTFYSAVYKINSSTGAIIFAKGYTPIGLSSILPEGGLCADQGYYMAMTDQQVGGFNYNIIRTDNLGNINDVDPGCPAVTLNPPTTTYAPTYSTPVPGVFTTGTGNVFTPVVTPISPTPTEHCLNVICTAPATPTPTATPATICNGSSSSLSATGGSNVTYQWFTVASGGTAFATGTPVSVSPTITTTYYVQSEDNTNPGCVSARAPVTVTVVQPVSAGTSNSLALCSNSTPVNLFSSLGGTPSAGGTWSGPSVLTGGSLGTFTQGTNTAGIYQYLVTGTSPCPNASANVTVTITTAPNAGTGTTTNVCSNGSAVNLFSLLTGSPSAGGTWGGPSALTGGSLGTFTPGTNTAGNYIYTVNGTGPCSAATATVTVNVTAAPNAGTNGSASLCSNGSAVNLFSLLGGTPSAGGSWSGPSALTGGSLGTFTPGTNTAGNYIYTVNGTGPCSAATATVAVTITTAPNAGTGTTTAVCSNGSAVNLFSLLGGTPSASGTWSGPSALTGGSLGTFTPGTNIGGNYIYTVNGTGPCSAATATVTVNVTTAPNAGTNGSTSLCSNAAAVNLFSLLGGTPSAGGSWSGPSALTGGSLGTFTPGTNIAGNYIYTVNGTGPCSAATATVTVNVTAAPNAGTNGSASLCSNGSAVNLFSLLGGTPSAGGSWSGPSALTGGSLGTFTPGTNTAGNYIYTVNGTGPCSAATATVAVTITTAPNAGTNGSTTLCSNAAAVNLFSLLGGTPSAGGSWSGPSALTGGSLGTFTPGTNTAGNYIYTVNGTGPCSAATATVAVTINTAPTISTVSATSTTICAGSSTTINATGTGASNFNVYTASSGGTLLGTTPLSVSPGTTTTYYVEAVSAAGCTNSGGRQPVTVTVIPLDNPSWTSPGATCVPAGPINLNTLITGTTGGTWSGTGVTGNIFDPTGLAGQTISITYSVGTSPCVQTSTQTISVQSTITGNWTSPGTICEAAGSINLNAFITGTAGGSWSGTGVTGNTFDPTGLSGSVNITYSVGVAPCSDAVVHAITVSPDVDPSWTSPGTTCSPAGSLNLNTFITGTSGGTWSGTGVSGNTFDPTGLDGQTISITYTVGASPCTETSTQTIAVAATITAAWTSPGTMCESDGIVNLNSLITGTAGGTWSGTGVTGNSFDPTGLSGSVNITYSVGTAPCDDAVTQSITVNASPLDPNVSTSANTVCAGDVVQITANGSGGGVTYNVYDAATGGNLLGTTTYTVTPGVGTNTYYVEAVNANGCVNLSGRVPVVVTVNALPTADAGVDQTICPSNSATLTASGGTSYVWETTETTASITVTPSGSEYYTVTVTDNNNCSATDSVLVTIYNTGALDANDDSTTVENITTLIYNVAVNDNGNISTITILSGPSHGTAFATGTNVNYDPTDGYVGYDTIVYQVCDAFCNTYCDTAILVIRVTDEIVVKVPGGFSPNGDGINDAFVIVGLEKYPENELYIYNRWGELVYSAKPYTNDWKGESNNAARKLGGEEVIDGTYFYVLTLEPGGEVLRGSLELRRK